MDKFNPQKDNPCWGCEFRKLDEADYTNVCLLDEDMECIREIEEREDRQDG